MEPGSLDMADTKSIEAARLSDPTDVSDAQRHLVFRRIIRGWWVTSRMEYLPDAVVHVMLPLLLVLRHETWSIEFLGLSSWGLLVWLMGHWVGSSLNCLADYNIDRLDVGYKDRLAKAIDRAGVRPLLWVNSAEILLATAVSLWLALRLGKPLLLLFWLIGLAFAYLYSFEPARLKARNLLNPITLTIIVYGMPLFFTYHLLSPVWNAFDVSALLTYCAQMMPMFLADEVSDHDEDQAVGIRNPCVTYGRTLASWAAEGIYVLACLVSVGLYVESARKWSLTWLGILGIATFGYLWVAREFALLAGLSRAVEESPDASVRAIRTCGLKRFSKTPMWLVATSVGALFLAIGETFA